MIRAHQTVFKDELSIDVRTMCNFSGCTESFFVLENRLCERRYRSSQYSWFCLNLPLQIRIRVREMERKRRGEKISDLWLTKR